MTITRQKITYHAAKLLLGGPDHAVRVYLYSCGISTLPHFVLIVRC